MVQNKKSIIFAAVSVVGSLASIVGLAISTPSFDFLKETQSFSNGFVALLFFFLIGFIVVVIVLNDRFHKKYHEIIISDNERLKSENDILSGGLKGEKTEDVIGRDNIIDSLRGEIDKLSDKLKIYQSLESELLGLFKSGAPFSFFELRANIDRKFSDSDIRVALTALGEKITCTNPKSNFSKYVIKNA